MLLWWANLKRNACGGQPERAAITSNLSNRPIKQATADQSSAGMDASSCYQEFGAAVAALGNRSRVVIAGDDPSRFTTLPLSAPHEPKVRAAACHVDRNAAAFVEREHIVEALGELNRWLGGVGVALQVDPSGVILKVNQRVVGGELSPCELKALVQGCGAESVLRGKLPPIASNLSGKACHSQRQIACESLLTSSPAKVSPVDDRFGSFTLSAWLQWPHQPFAPGLISVFITPV